MSAALSKCGPLHLQARPIILRDFQCLDITLRYAAEVDFHGIVPFSVRAMGEGRTATLFAELMRDQVFIELIFRDITGGAEKSEFIGRREMVDIPLALAD